MSRVFSPKILTCLIFSFVFMSYNKSLLWTFISVSAIYFAIDYLTYQKSLKSSYIIAFLCAFVFADISYNIYFDLSYTFFIMAVIFILLLEQKRYNIYFLISLVFINSIIFIFIKYNPNSSNINKYHSMTRGVLMTADNPEEALEQFKIDRQYAILNNSNCFDKYPIIDSESDILKENFYCHYNFISVGLYYSRNPKQMIDMLNISAQINYQTKSTNKLFILYNQLKKRFMPATASFMIIWSILAVAVGYKNKYRTIVISIIILMGLFEIIISIINSGDTNLFKDTFLYRFVFNFVNLIGVSYVINNWW